MLTCVETYAKPNNYSCLGTVIFINPSLYFVNAPLDTKNHEENNEGQVGESFLNPSFTPIMTHMQKQKQTTWVKENKLIVKSSEKDYNVRYYMVTGLETYDDVILGEKFRVVRAIGVWQNEKLDYEINEGAVVIVETGWGFEHCGATRYGTQSRIYINHMGIDIENVDLTKCPGRKELVPIIHELEEHGLSIMSAIIDPWVDIVPYVLWVLRMFGFNIEI